MKIFGIVQDNVHKKMNVLHLVIKIIIQLRLCNVYYLTLLICTEINKLEKDLNYNFYILKKDLDLTNFPLLNYKIDYNKRCEK